MKQRILLLMMTALLSVGAWATEIWNEGATLNWNYFTLPKMSMTAGDVLTFHITSVGADWSTMKLITTDETKEGWDKRGTELMSLDHRSGSNVIVVVTDDIASAAPDGIIVYGENNVVVSSVDYEQKPSSYNLFSGSETITWSSEKGLSSNLFGGVQAGDLLKIEISAVGGSEWGEDVQLRSSSWGNDATILKSAKVNSATTVTFEFDADLVTAAKNNGLYIRGNSFTMTSVDIVYAHDVTIAGGITNGTVTASKSKAAYGETVTLTVTPDGNYELGTLTVTDESSNEIAVTNNGDGTYTFTMPATAVTVNATFNHVSAVTLDTENIKLTNSQRHNEEDGTVKLWIDTTEENGWDLTIGRPVSSSEFSGVKVEYAEAYNVQMVITYVDGTTDTKSFTAASGSNNSDVVNFASGKIVTSIKFSKPTSTENGMIQFKSRTAVSLQIKDDATYTTPTTSMTLTYETLEDTGMDSETATVTYDTANQAFTIASGDGHWAFWDFTLPIPTSLYNGINFTLTQAPAGSAIEIIYADETVQQVSITEAVSSEKSFNVNFDRTGNVTRIRFAGAGTYKMGTCTAKPAKYQVTVSTAKYATFGDLGSTDVINYGSADPSGLKAYIAYVNVDKVKLEEVSKATANTAVILYANVETATSYTVNTTDDSADTPSQTNQLHISDGTVTGDESTIYVLANDNNGVGFYLVKNGSAITAGKAYLKVSSGSGEARQFIGFGDDTTGISEELRVKNEEFASATYFDLQGRRVAQPTKGLYVVNGKKVVIK